MTDDLNDEPRGDEAEPTKRRRPRRAVSPVTTPAPVAPPDAATSDAGAVVGGAEPVEDTPEVTKPARRPAGTRKPRAAKAPAAKGAAAKAPAERAEPSTEEPAVAQAAPEQPAPEQPAGGSMTAEPSRSRRRRATATVTTPEPRADRAGDQRLDVLAELGASTTPAAQAAEADRPAESAPGDVAAEAVTAQAEATEETAAGSVEEEGPRLPAAALLFQAPDLTGPRPRRRAEAPAGPPGPADEEAEEDAGTQSRPPEETESRPPEESAEESEEASVGRRRRRRGGRGRRRSNGDATEPAAQEHADEKDAQVDEPDVSPPRAETTAGAAEPAEQGEDETTGTSRRRRRRRRSREDAGQVARDEVTALQGSTRLEAKRQRRREGRESGRRRREVITESEFLARRESVDRRMVVREQDGLNQIAVLEDGILVEHYVARHTQTSMVGNVYLGRVQNVLPGMEAAFVDIGKGRNGVLYAGEVNWDAAGMEGQPRRIEHALKSGDTVLVQVTKDPIGHKGARLTSQVTLAGRYLVLVPSGAMTGISRKLPDTERARLKKLLKQIVPEGAGVIVRTAAEGATEEQLTEDVERLTKIWADIEAKAASAKTAPVLLKGEPELAVRVVRDVFNEDFRELVVSGDQAWATISAYVEDLAPDLADRMRRWTEDRDIFAAYRIDEQLAKGMDRKVWLPSGGSLVIDRTEAMTVIDVNTGKFTGSGGTLEETVTRNNLEAAEEIVRQLRLRDIGGIIVIDFIDMVLESNRELVLRRLVECLGRDRTRHQVAEVTSLGLVQMTRKRVGQGLVEAFSTPCEHCNGRGFIVHDHPVERDGGGNGEDEHAGRRRSKPKAAVEPPAVEDSHDREEIKTRLAAIAAAAASAHDDEEEPTPAVVDEEEPTPAVVDAEAETVPVSVPDVDATGEDR